MINDWKHKEQHKKMISLEKDLPIQHVNEDLLNRDHFAKQLAEAVTAYMEQPGNTDGLVIGLEGPWGSGKTSLFNLMKEHLGNQCIVKTFNAWLTSDKVGLTTEFFRILTDFSEKKSVFNTRKVRKYAEKIITSVAQTTISLPMASLGTSVTFPIGKIVEPLLEQPSLIARKKKITASIKKEKNQPWMVLFIDDLDRLSYDEIGTVFQLIKNIADFPKVIYVLAYDHEIVAKALDKVQMDKGNEYLQKVVQVVYDIPLPGEEEVFNYFGQKLEKIVGNTDSYLIDKDHFTRLLYAGLKKYFENIRDCNRVLNAFQLKYLLCQNDCDLGDLLAVTVFELFNPVLYKALPKYRNILLGKDQSGIFEVKKEVFEQYFSALLGLEGIRDKERCEELLRIMFPKIQSIMNKRNEADTNGLGNKIQYEDSFDRYFELAIQSTDVPVNELISFLQLKTKAEICEYLEAWARQKQGAYAFEHLCRFLTSAQLNPLPIELSKNKLLLYLEALSKVYFEESAKGFFAMSVYRYEKYFIDCLLAYCLQDSETKMVDGKYLAKLFFDSKIAVFILEDILTECSKGHNWIFDNQNLKQSIPIVSGKDFQLLEDAFIKRIQQGIQDKSLYQEVYYRQALYIWKRVKPKDYQLYIKQEHCPIEILFLLHNFVMEILVNSGTSYKEYCLSKAFIGDYDAASVYEWAKRCVASPEFQEFPSRKSDRVLAYILIYERHLSEKTELDKITVYQNEVDQKSQKICRAIAAGTK